MLPDRCRSCRTVLPDCLPIRLEVPFSGLFFPDQRRKMRRLRSIADFTTALGAPCEGERGAARFDAVCRPGDDRNREFSVAQREVITESSIRVELDLVAADPDGRIGVSAAVEDDLGVDVHEKPALRAQPKRLGAPAGANRTKKAARRRPERFIKACRKLARGLTLQILEEMLAQKVIDFR